MLSHIVLFRPRRDLSHADREAFASAFEAAVQKIPGIRRVRVGRRVMFGAGYEQGAPAMEYSVIIDFDDLAGLKTYLAHPAHEDLGARFSSSLEQALVYDYEIQPLEGVGQLLRKVRE